MTNAIKRNYFVVATFLLLALTIAGFSDNLFTDTGQPSNFDPKFIIHGLICGAWMILLFVQASLIRAQNVRVHKTLGMVGLVIAVGVTLSTFWLFFVTWKGWAVMTPEVKANRILLPSYSVCIALAFINRKNRDLHKRLICTGTLFMLDPVLARCYDPFVVPWFMTGWSEPQIDRAFLPWFFTTWLGFFLSLFAYDAITLRKIHSVTMAALIWFGVVWAFAFLS